MKKQPLTLDKIREANIERCEESYHAVADWSPSDWACSMAGEAGEVCDAVKKLRRLGDFDKTYDHPKRADKIKDIAHEMADTILYLDLLAARLDIDLSQAVIEKFNLVSTKYQSKVTL